MTRPWHVEDARRLADLGQHVLDRFPGFRFVEFIAGPVRNYFIGVLHFQIVGSWVTVRPATS